MPRYAAFFSCLRLLSFLTLALLTPCHAQAANAAPALTPEERTELEKYPSYAGPLNVLEANAGNGLHDFLAANEGKTVYLDLSIVRYMPMDPSYFDDPRARAATDRFANPVFNTCWPDQRADYHGILNFGEAGFPLPRDAADIEAGCSTRVRFDLEMIESVSAFDKLWGDNKVQVFLKGFFKVARSAQDGGKTLYTLTEQQDIPFETRLAFDTHKTAKHPEADLSLRKD